MKRRLFLFTFYSIALLACLVSPSAADVGFGIPDMIEEKVEDLDQKVRNRKAQQNQFPALQPFEVATSDSLVVIEESVISRDARKIYVLTNDKSAASGGLDITLFDGSGEREGSSSTIFGAVPEYLAVNSSGDPVVLSRDEPGSNSQLHIFNEDLEGLPKTALLTDTYTTLAVDSQDFTYTAGLAGVRKYDDFPDTVWVDTSYRVPEDNLIVDGDSVFVTNLSETPSATPSELTLQVLALDGSDGSVDWKETLVDSSATDISGTSYLTIGSDRLHVLLQESRATGEGDTMFVRNLQDGSSINTVTIQNQGTLSGNDDPIPMIVGTANGFPGQVFSGDKGGTITRFDRTGSPVFPQDLSDSPAIPWIIDDSDSIYSSVQTDTEGAVFASSKNLSDSTIVFFSSSDTLPVNIRPVWLTDGFLGIVFNGGRLSVNKTPFEGDNPENSPWPHHDGNNQATRLKN